MYGLSRRFSVSQSDNESYRMHFRILFNAAGDDVYILPGWL